MGDGHLGDGVGVAGVAAEPHKVAIERHLQPLKPVDDQVSAQRFLGQRQVRDADALEVHHVLLRRTEHAHGGGAVFARPTDHDVAVSGELVQL